MGGYFSSFPAEPQQEYRKRKLSIPCDDEAPTTKRIRSTYNYVYRELFCKGEGSDLTVKSMGHSWLLHRLYVKQSPFFSAMLEGGWKESGSDVIELELSDVNITKEALDIVFGSFYHDSVLLSEKIVLSVLAAATWFHLEDIRLLCSDFMESKACLRNVVEFFETAKQYNLPKLTDKIIRWVADHLLLLKDSYETFEFLRKIPVDLMCEVLRKPDLVVVQMEQDVFVVLLKWVYLQQHPDFEYNSQSPSFLDEAYANFTAKGCSLLELPEGEVYVPAFRCIRWDHIVNEHNTTQRLIWDRIIPKAWLSSVFSRQWLRVLQMHELQTTCTHSSVAGRSGTGDSYTGSGSPFRLRTTLGSRAFTINSTTTAPGAVDTSSEPGPGPDLPADVFWATSERCGRLMPSGDSTCSWRWTGYHFGMDVVIKYKRRTFSVIRFTESSSAAGSVSHAPRFRLMLALRVKSLRPDHLHGETDTSQNPDQSEDQAIDVVQNPTCQRRDRQSGDRNGTGGIAQCVSTSGVLSLSLEQNVIQEILRLPDDFTFPAVVSANILRYDPLGCDQWDPFPSSSEVYI